MFKAVLLLRFLCVGCAKHVFCRYLTLNINIFQGIYGRYVVRRLITLPHSSPFLWDEIKSHFYSTSLTFCINLYFARRDTQIDIKSKEFELTGFFSLSFQIMLRK